MENKNIVIIYVPSYGLSKDPTRLTCMSYDTALAGIKLMKQGIGDIIVFSTAYEWWETEAKLKRDLARQYGVRDDLVKIIGGTPERTTSYIEAMELFKIVSNPDDEIIVVGQKYHTKRASDALGYLFRNVRVVRVSTKMERILDPSWLKSMLCSASLPNFILYNWLLNLITPWMMKRQMKKEER